MKRVKKIKIKNSNKLFKKALKIIPYGSQTYSKGVKAFSDGLKILIYFFKKYLYFINKK